MNLESAAFAHFGFDVQPTTMALNNVLHNRQPKPCATTLATTMIVDAVESLGQPRKMLAGNSLALVAHVYLSTKCRPVKRDIYCCG